jgi:succinate dehydrogenase / fumarate reductase cytochrome b subunit
VQVALYDMNATQLANLTHDILQNPVNLALYLIGLVAAVFHFSNGMWTFLITWGVTVGPRAQRVSSYVWAVVFVLVSYLGISALLAFAQSDFMGQMAQH